MIADLIASWSAVVGMRLIRHKTQKLKFKLVYVFLVLHVILLTYLMYSGVLTI